MRSLIIIVLLISTFNLYSQDLLGKDSGNREVYIYNKTAKTNTALVIIGGIHGDEQDTIKVVNNINQKLNTNLSLYIIPEINPTLSYFNRRGYLRESLNNKGMLLPGTVVTDFNKSLYYRIFYGNEKSYLNGINHYIDPNRDFIERVLPTTNLLIELLNKLSKEYENIVVISFHGYMQGGRIYPEYSVENGEIIVNSYAWEIAKLLEESTGYKREKMYAPAISIIERFEGELIRYTSRYKNVTALDIELDSNTPETNVTRSLKGITKLIEFLNKE